MRSVEQAQFDEFVGLDLVAHDGPDPVPSRSTGGEVVLEHPHGEVLGGHRAAVVDADQLADVGDGRSGGGRHYPVHHGVRERDVIGDEVQDVVGCRAGVQELGEYRTSDVARWTAGCHRTAP